MTTLHQKDCETFERFTRQLAKAGNRKPAATSTGPKVKMGNERVMDEIKVLFNLYMDGKEG